MALLFLGFRLAYIPASVLSHSGHGQPWLTAAVGLLLTFGLEALARRRSGEVAPQERRGGLAAAAVGLLLLGLFPEEAPTGLILWAGVGVAWGAATRDRRLGARQPRDWLLFMAGGALGLTGLYGPGSWIMALLILASWRYWR